MVKHLYCNIFDSGADVIFQQVNCKGVMGSGLAKQVRERHPEVYEAYRNYCNNAKQPLLGTWNFAKAFGTNYWIMNLFGQDGYGRDKQYTDYDALRKSLEATRIPIGKKVTIAFPYKMGCDRGGGDWNVVYNMIMEVYGDQEGDILICEYHGE